MKAATCHPHRPAKGRGLCGSCYMRGRPQHPMFKTWQRRSQWRSKYGITEAQYLVVLRRQRGRCAICRRLPGGELLSVDHDHRTRRFRGLLCRRCNRALAFLGDGPRLVAVALDYLKGG